ncbi:Serine/threonine-protein phosphatase 6 regulatory ankyrin repeat subunit C [Daldinia childiae]|uniref:Serine/threonine-protein phosphatase 6 regulatory ankyrin repeat subunit C n=1 Tax=Daldinia childiae TaxID=326645 RepID=UPI001444CC49|nr:Serine/threonine-protein phosphatase 6 regulatory ankyrin repeat subunit C [Daldinia childiae]KAF3069658.1 Serine/threonine-protein phosphatase 6 regulatory ankyrin repeat subunit C [Daldinia childiae]
MPRAEPQGKPQGESHMDLTIANKGPSNELARMPMEIILEIAKHMSQATKACLAQTCRDFSVIMDVALYDQDSKEDRHALWWACVNSEYRLLQRIIKYDPTLVNYHFQRVHTMKVIPSTPEHLHDLCSRFNGSEFSIRLTPLTVAIRFGSFHAFTTLLKLGADVNDPAPSNGMGAGKLWFPIHWLFRITTGNKDFEECFSLLINHGANVNQAPLLYQAPLLPGITGKRGDGIPLLGVIDFKPRFERGVWEPHPTARYEDQLKDRFGKAMVLLRSGAKPNLRDPESSYTPIFKAARCLDSYNPKAPFNGEIALRHDVKRVYEEVVLVHALKLFKALIDYGGNPNTSCDGTTALHVLCKHSQEHRDLILYLLREGANINGSDENGRTPIYEYVMYPNNHKLLREFIKQGANVHHRDFQGRTPLHVACADYKFSHAKLFDTIVALLENGTDPTLVDKEGNTPLDLLDKRWRPTWTDTRTILLQATLKASGADLGDFEDDDDWVSYNDLK